MQNVEKVISLLKKEYTNTKYYLNFSSPLQLLVATILSAQVRDAVVNATTPVLFRKYKTARDYANASPNELEGMIKSVTFYKNKAKNIRETCSILDERYGGRVPQTMDELTQLPGIGRKTANAILANAFGKVVGIPCDTHVIRLSYRLGWTSQKDPDKIEQDIIKIIPRKYWKKIPWLLKDHGRAVCKSVPDCVKCSLDRICPKQGVTGQTKKNNK